MSFRKDVSVVETSAKQSCISISLKYFSGNQKRLHGSCKRGNNKIKFSQ